MRNVVCVKWGLDTSVSLRVVNGTVEQDAPRRIEQLAAADRAALEGALTFRAARSEPVTAIAVGEANAAQALRYCLARGVDRAVQLQTSAPDDPRAAAGAVARRLAESDVDLVWCGGRSGDGGSGRFSAELAARLDWPLLTGVAAVSLTPDGQLRVERRLERGDREIALCRPPAVFAVDVTFAAGRYVPLYALRRAAKAALEVVRDTAEPDGLCERIALEPARPRPKRVAGPDAKLSAMDRLGHLLSGGVKQKRNSEFVEGTPEEIAAEIVRFLESKGFVGKPKG